MKRILIASDLSRRSQPALRRAISLARQFGARLLLLHVVDDDQPPTLVDEACRATEAALGEELRRVSAGDLVPAPSVSVIAGDPFQAIADEAHRHEAALIVMGTHRKRLLGDIFTGTTIERVMRLAGRPVLMVNRDNDVPYENVLAATDLSEPSAHALRTAHDLGVLDPAHASVVHGFQPLGEGMMAYAGIERERIDEHVMNNDKQARMAAAAFLRDQGLAELSTRLLVEKGPPFAAIDAGIRHLQPDLLVIGTRGHGGLKHILLGSVADEVLRKVSCDVLAVPPKATSPDR
jgi:universal stress protein E